MKRAEALAVVSELLREILQPGSTTQVWEAVHVESMGEGSRAWRLCGRQRAQVDVQRRGLSRAESLAELQNACTVGTAMAGQLERRGLKYSIHTSFRMTSLKKRLPPPLPPQRLVGAVAAAMSRSRSGVPAVERNASSSAAYWKNSGCSGPAAKDDGSREKSERGKGVMPDNPSITASCTRAKKSAQSLLAPKVLSVREASCLFCLLTQR